MTRLIPSQVRTCLQCGALFGRPPGRSVKEFESSKYCSTECRMKAPRMPRHNIQEGQRFGRLIIEREADRSSSGKRQWECLCDCGVRKVCGQGSILSGKTASCGCLQSEMTSSRFTKHGLKGTPEYEIWKGIKRRCLNPNTNGYKKYGARGITICDLWRDSFMAFLEHVGQRPSPQHSIDRIDNDRGYEPGNVRWATMVEQNRNLRDNVFLTLDGKTMTMAAWADEVGIPASTIRIRLRSLGWDVERALRTPLRTRNKQADLERGETSKGQKVSHYQVRCDDLCSERAAEYMRLLERKGA